MALRPQRKLMIIPPGLIKLHITANHPPNDERVVYELNATVYARLYAANDGRHFRAVPALQVGQPSFQRGK